MHYIPDLRINGLKEDDKFNERCRGTAQGLCRRVPGHEDLYEQVPTPQ